eukprot:gene11512-13605_t
MTSILLASVRKMWRKSARLRTAGDGIRDSKEPSKERDRSPKKGRDKEDDRSPVKGRDKGEDRSPEKDRQQEYRDKEDGCKIFIGGLAYETDDYALRKKFEKYGSITDVYIPVDTDNRRPRGFAFVTFGDPRDAEDSVRAMDGVSERRFDEKLERTPEGMAVVAKAEDMEDLVEDTAVAVPRFAGTTNKAVVPGEVVAGFLTMMVAVVVATRIETIAMKTNAMKTGAGVLIEIGIEFFFQMNRVRETSF